MRAPPKEDEHDVESETDPRARCGQRESKGGTDDSEDHAFSGGRVDAFYFRRSERARSVSARRDSGRGAATRRRRASCVDRRAFVRGAVEERRRAFRWRAPPAG